MEDPTRAPGDAPTPDAPEARAKPAADAPDMLAVTQERDALRVSLGEVRSLVGAAADADSRAVIDQVRTLVAQAADGRQYRADLLEETLKEGVRAHGPAFAADDYRALLEGASLARMKTVRDGFTAVAAQTFKGGRTTVDTDEAPKAVDGESRRAEAPAAAFAG